MYNIKTYVKKRQKNVKKNISYHCWMIRKVTHPQGNQRKINFSLICKINQGFAIVFVY